jgi:threonylcarbamoyladenosine tRNA methylthiotransferase MtaB
MLQNTLDLIEECGLIFIHAFPFSPRAGTPAARMPLIDRQVIKQRAARIRNAGQRSLIRYLDRQQGRELKVLIEREGVGRSEQFVQVEGVSGQAGEIVAVRISGHNNTALIGQTLHGGLKTEGSLRAARSSSKETVA